MTGGSFLESQVASSKEWVWCALSSSLLDDPQHFAKVLVGHIEAEFTAQSTAPNAFDVSR